MLDRLCIRCEESLTVCGCKLVCVNQPFGPPLSEDKRIYEWRRTIVCDRFTQLKNELKQYKEIK